MRRVHSFTHTQRGMRAHTHTHLLAHAATWGARIRASHAFTLTRSGIDDTRAAAQEVLGGWMGVEQTQKQRHTHINALT